MYEKELVQKVSQKYKTTNPYEIAKERGIIVLFEPLGSINGYFNTAFRQKFIHINDGLTEQVKLFTAAHELGHALLHPKANTPFLRKSTYLSVNRMEVEANRFAVHLLVSDHDLIDYQEYTVSQVASFLGWPEELVILRTKGS